LLPLNFNKVFVLGLGVSGRAAAQLLMHSGVVVMAYDDHPSACNNAKDLIAQGLIFSDQLNEAEALILSPGISSDHQIICAARSANIPIFGEIELAARLFEPSRKAVGITGTNGKTTVTLLVTHVLNSSGKKASALGNNGVALTQYLLSSPSPEEIFVIELSSYQLETLTSKVLDAAVVLNITPDHLDRYKTMKEYAVAKAQIVNGLKPDAKLYLQDQVAKKYGDLFLEQPLIEKKVFGPESKALDIFKDYWNHDIENATAAWLLCSALGVTKEEFILALKTFKKPPHRIEFVREYKGITYINDSKGTNIDAVIKAVQGLETPILLIAGGVDKGFPYDLWKESFQNKVKHVFAIGQAARSIKADLNGHTEVSLFETLEEAVLAASKMAKSGESVLLSPGCASFDMFRDYSHRGEQFKKIVMELKI